MNQVVHTEFISETINRDFITGDGDTSLPFLKETFFQYFLNNVTPTDYYSQNVGL